MLRFEPDSSLADWFARRDEPWGELVTMGPAGFGSYARIRYLEEDRISQRVLFARLRVHLAARTKTPGDCLHGLWAGAVSGMHGDPARCISPWFPASVLTGPKVRIPNREYMLFRGHLDEVGHWGATDPATGSSRDGELPAPHLLWPADPGAPLSGHNDLGRRAVAAGVLLGGVPVALLERARADSRAARALPSGWASWPDVFLLVLNSALCLLLFIMPW